MDNNLIVLLSPARPEIPCGVASRRHGLSVPTHQRPQSTAGTQLCRPRMSSELLTSMRHAQTPMDRSPILGGESMTSIQGSSRHCQTGVYYPIKGRYIKSNNNNTPPPQKKMYKIISQNYQKITLYYLQKETLECYVAADLPGKFPLFTLF